LRDNAASLRVMEKIGLRLVGDLEHAGLPHVLYSATGSARLRR
jgi:RimJ/RimL family protein N-acetyltransferase